MIDKLLEKIDNRNLRLAVLGSGYVGLPTAALFADAGFSVLAIDVRPELVSAVNDGLSPVREPGLAELISRNVKPGRLRALLSADADLSVFDAIIISVQTPLGRGKKPDLSFLEKALDDVAACLKKGMLVVVSSTLPPGAMQTMVKPKLESSGLKADVDFYLAYVPERIAPGNALKEFVESPRLVGGIGPNSTKVASELFKVLCKKVIETDAATAEVAKLAENTYRDVNIAFANQLAMICEQYGVDVRKVIELANTHPRVNIHRPGPGVGGPCLPKDPFLLVANIKDRKAKSLIEVARRINDYMPKHVVRIAVRALRHAGKEVEKCKVAVLGTAYKADVDDARLSPSKPIINGLKKFGIRVVAYDPHCRESFEAEPANSLIEAVKDADCIIIVTDHSSFKTLNLEEIKKAMNYVPVIVDCRGLIDPETAKKVGFVYYGVGRISFQMSEED